MIYNFLPLIILFVMSFANTDKKQNTSEILIDNVNFNNSNTRILNVYSHLNSNNFALPNIKSFTEALTGFYMMKEKGLVKKDVLTIIDFSLSSNVKRLWVIDLTTNTIVSNTLVAHGRNTGDEFATSFSNKESSYKSSLGFYATAEVYNGKHGQSLKLDGLEKGINDHARQRGIVIHAANYVSESFINRNKRLGRSQGCPALPEELSAEIIKIIKNKSLLFIYHPSRTNLFEANKLSA